MDHKLLLELSLFLNQELYKDNKINYQLYKNTENLILKQIIKGG